MTVDPIETWREPADASHELMTLYTQVLELLVSGAALSEVLSAVTLALERMMPGTRCAVLFLDRAENVLRYGAGPSLPPSWCAYINPLPVGPKVGSCGSAAFLRRRVIVADVSKDERWVTFRKVALKHGLRACWSTPIVGGKGEVLGTFAVYHDKAHEPTLRELGLVDRCTHLAAIAIDHAGLFGALSESEDRFRSAFEANAVGMALVGLDGRFLRVNRALCEMLGRDELTLLGMDFRVPVHPEHIQGSSDALLQLTKSLADSVQLEQEYLREDGTQFPVTFTASALRSADGSLAGFCAHLLDLTHRQAAEQERRRCNEAEVAQRTAEAASRAKSQFLSAMSHELRTPLTALLGFAELLESLEPERRVTATRRIREAANHVISLVDDVLDIAKIEASAVTLDLEPVALEVVVREMLELVGPLAAERDVEILAPTSRSVTVTADPRRLRQALLNLVTNAIKYNRTGGQVTVEIRRQAGRGLVRVTDTGVGVSPSLQWRLFVPFDRLGAERSGIPGSGLGLSLSRALVSAMGGDLVFQSQPGQGSNVEIRLPLAGAARSIDRSHASRPEPALSVRKDVRGIVLHVEDDAVCLELVAELLRRRPAVRLVPCATGNEGLIAARKLRPHLVLLDLDLPDMTGEEFIAALSHPELGPPPPITIVSGRLALDPVSLPTFRKPIAVASLLRHVDERLSPTDGADSRRGHRSRS